MMVWTLTGALMILGSPMLASFRERYRCSMRVALTLPVTPTLSAEVRLSKMACQGVSVCTNEQPGLLSRTVLSSLLRMAWLSGCLLWRKCLLVSPNASRLGLPVQ
jgi:hypothetical protein